MTLTKDNWTNKEIGNDGILYIPLSLILPAVIIIVALFLLQITPFGEHNLAFSDGQYYLNNYAFYNRLLHGQENFLYSLKNGLGNNEWSILSWGGISPVLLLTYFASLENIPQLFTWIIVLNLSVCGLTMYLLLANVRGHKISNLIFSTSYALMGFNVAYCYHFFFFIGPQLLPLVALGLRKIIKGKSPLLYVISLAAGIFFNFYFGFMLCVASLAIFVAFMYAESETLKGRKWTITRIWFCSSAISGFLAAPMWLPAIKAFMGGGRIDQALGGGISFSENMPFIQIFSKLFSGANSQYQQVDGLPYIFCGILVVALVILYFMNQEIPAKHRKAAGFVLGFYLLTFYISAFSKLMHGGTHTNWFNYRYSFVFSFFLIALAAEEFIYIERLTTKDAKQCIIALLVSIVLVFSTSYEFISGGAVVLDLVLLVLMWLIFCIHKKKPEKVTKKVFAGLLILVVSVNMFANFTLSVKSLRDWEKDLTLYKANILFSGSSVDAIKTYDTSFFRMEKDVSESETIGMDPYIYGYNGVSFSGPAVRMFVHKQQNKLGINWYDMRHWYEKGVPVATDSLLGLKYILASRDDIEDEKEYQRIVATDENAVYQNPNALSIAILVEDAVQDLVLGNNVFENLNNVWKKMTGGEQDIFTIQEDVTYTMHNLTDGSSVTSEDIKTSVSNSEADIEEDTQDSAYIEIEFVAEKTGPVYRCDTSVPKSDNGSSGVTVKYCGYYQEGETVKDTSRTNSVYASKQDLLNYCSHIVYAYADNSVVGEYAEKLNSRELNVNVKKDTDIKGTFTAVERQRILFTIPWDEGWTCFIDGQKVDIDKTWDLFMSVSVPEGEHTYELKFFPAWLDYGLYICAFAFVGLIVLMVIYNKRKKIDNLAQKRVDEEQSEAQVTIESEDQVVVDTKCEDVKAEEAEVTS